MFAGDPCLCEKGGAYKRREAARHCRDYPFFNYFFFAAFSFEKKLACPRPHTLAAEGID